MKTTSRGVGMLNTTYPKDLELAVVIIIITIFFITYIFCVKF